MKNLSWQRWVGLGALAALAMILPACSSDGHLNFLGYSSKPLFDTTIKTVYVPMIKNDTMDHGSIEFDVTQALVNEIQLRTPYRVVHSLSRADTELVCKLKKHEKVVININQLGETREAQVTLTFEVTWLDRRAGHEGEALSGPKRKEGELPPPLGPDGKEVPPKPVLLTPAANFIPEVGGSIATAQAQIYKILATQVVNMMERSGTGW